MLYVSYLDGSHSHDLAGHVLVAVRGDGGDHGGGHVRLVPRHVPLQDELTGRLGQTEKVGFEWNFLGIAP